MGFNMDDYEPVEVRIARLYHADPGARVTTDLIAYGDTGYIVKAAVYRTGEAEPWATGYAQENVTQRGVNSTSALENCETSAIGRALANAGFATKGKRASREEMTKTQPAPSKPRATDDQLDEWAGRIVEAESLAELNAVAHDIAAYDVGDAHADLVAAYSARKAVLDDPA
jgi:hypothetical protein